MKKTSFRSLPRLFLKRKLICAFLAAAPLAAMAQQTVFFDNFASSTLNQTNAFPGGSPTASSTSYTCACPKSSPNFSIAPGHLHVYCPATSTANTEVQALFTKYPITLTSPGDYIELTFTFTDTTNFYNGNQTPNINSSGLNVGIFNSGGTPPLGGTVLQGGLGGSGTAFSGGCSNWLGYNAFMQYGQTLNEPWSLNARPAQTTAGNANIDQELVYAPNVGHPSGGASLGSSTPTAPVPFPTLNIDSQYTVQYRVTLAAVGTLTISNAIYAGTSVTPGGIIFSNIGTATGATYLTTNFDGLGIGFRADGASGFNAWTNDINSITVVAGLAAQAGPYFTLTNFSGGSGCGSADIGLNGSVTTNVYLLYTNGVFNGQQIPGTGSSLDFGFQTKAAIYTIYASNVTTTSVGPMNGSQVISVSAPVIIAQPANFSTVTNAPATFNVVASGNALTYLWYKNGVALANGGDYSGVTTSNLLVSPARAADVATTANGYSVVVSDPCGDSVTSTPNASLTLQAPNNLVWQGNNSGAIWDVGTTLNFTNPAGAAQAFIYGDNVTFNDSSVNTSVTLVTNVIPSLVTVNGSQSYTMNGPGGILGFGSLIDNSSGTLSILNTNTYTGVTVLNSNATLSLGNSAAGNDGFITGLITVNTNCILNYNYNNNFTIANALAGSGTVNYESSLGGTLTLAIAAVNSNFTGVVNIQAGIRVHAQTGSVYPFGNGSTINVPDGAQAWCDTATYPNTFNIGGPGWPGAATGAISVFGSIFTGAINLVDNARISGTITGGTVLCAISGPFQLEILGNTNSYVLSMGPTNGVHTYASTLITSGTVRALNTNALSTGPLAIDTMGDLRLNSWNLSVSNLADASPSTVSGFGSTIENTGTTNAVLTIGADNSSQTFSGLLFNGGTGSLGLTKIGTGTEALSGASTCTGPITVSGGKLQMSGSFNSASQIIVGSSGIYDVTGAGGTLTLNSGQTLGGNGTVNGALVASVGSTVASGSPLGTLTITGNGTINGTYKANLNRAGTPSNCSHLTSSGGSITFSGATLSVTNVGSVLQVGDFFQLFPGATAGFTTYNLQASDPVNNVTYTWNNTVSSNGKITVASVTPNTIIPNIPPKIASFSLSGANVVISATNGVNNGTYYLLQSTNLSLPLPQWTPVATNVVTVSGGTASFSFTGTNAVTSHGAHQFYILSSTNN